jgi:hypothetical protein
MLMSGLRSPDLGLNANVAAIPGYLMILGKWPT